MSLAEQAANPLASVFVRPVGRRPGRADASSAALRGRGLPRPLAGLGFLKQLPSLFRRTALVTQNQHIDFEALLTALDDQPITWTHLATGFRPVPIAVHPTLLDRINGELTMAKKSRSPQPFVDTYPSRRVVAILFQCCSAGPPGAGRVTSSA